MPVAGCPRNMYHLLWHPIALLVRYHYVVFLHWLPCSFYYCRLCMMFASQISYLLVTGVTKVFFSCCSRTIFASRRSSPFFWVSQSYAARHRRLSSRRNFLILYSFWRLTRRKRLIVVTCTFFLRHKDLLLLLSTYNFRVTESFSCIPFDVQRIVSVFVL